VRYFFSGGIAGSSLDRLRDVVVREGDRWSLNDDGANLYVESARYELFVQDVGGPDLVFSGGHEGDLSDVVEYLATLRRGPQDGVALEDVVVEEADSGRVVWPAAGG